MSNSFNKQNDVTPDEVKQVSGGGFDPFPLPPGRFTPPVFVTQAIGEDGGDPPAEVLR